MRKGKLQLYDCDRCNFTFKKHTLRKQRGMLLCSGCFDTTLEIEPVNIRWRSPRDNSTSIIAVTTPIVFTITTAGVTSVGKSQTKTREGVTTNYEMYVVGAPTIITSNPQIVAMPDKTILTLIGTHDVSTVTFAAGNGTDMASAFTLYNNSTLQLVYSAHKGLWVEASRNVGAIS